MLNTMSQQFIIIVATSTARRLHVSANSEMVDCVPTSNIYLTFVKEFIIACLLTFSLDPGQEI